MVVRKHNPANTEQQLNNVGCSNNEIVINVSGTPSREDKSVQNQRSNEEKLKMEVHKEPKVKLRLEVTRACQLKHRPGHQVCGIKADKVDLAHCRALHPRNQKILQ